MRFVLMSLVVMVFAFYELSGGKDFVPRSETRRMAAQAEGLPGFPDTPGTARRPAQLAAATRTDLPVTPIRKTATPAPSRAEAMAAVDTPRTRATPAEAATIASAAAPAGLYPRADDDVASPGITLVSLEDNPALFAQPLIQDRAAEESDTVTVAPSLATAVARPVTAAPDPAAAPRDDFISPQRDIRSVNGSSVNMRNGPGTNYSVLARLGRDAKVEIIADPGNGWVQLRPLQGGPVGWMADYLLTRG
ncbi:SH3 domain-containing protein [Marinibacterium sp. SX1]|uniref:SH3 domain-containing protein n=1 Tax=Marinibacterium sp. SX1 TaxID=3388424 RepID=UPI003D177EAC